MAKHKEFPESSWRDTLALLAATFERMGLPLTTQRGLALHAQGIGDDLEGWGLLDVELHGPGPAAPGEVAAGILASMASDLYTAGDESPMRDTIYAATNTWLKSAMAALAEVTRG